jgi:predicted hotdog family 3-hydroxylacyl-ACP dehydratase
VMERRLAEAHVGVHRGWMTHDRQHRKVRHAVCISVRVAEAQASRSANVLIQDALVAAATTGGSNRPVATHLQIQGGWLRNLRFRENFISGVTDKSSAR